MKSLAVILIGLTVTGWSMPVSVSAGSGAGDVSLMAQKRDDKDPKKKDPPGPPVVRDKRDRGKEPPPKPPRKPSGN